MVRFNSQREVVRQLMRSYFESCRLHDDLEALGVSVKAIDYLGEHCADVAMDIVGFPVDDSSKEDESSFSREWLFDAMPGRTEPAALDSEVDRYVDFLYSEYGKLKQDNPHLFE